MKSFDLNALGVEELGKSQLIGINGGGPLEEILYRTFVLIVDFFKTFGPYIVQENCERATSPTYQPYADLGHR
jgi:hypothetical protein